MTKITIPNFGFSPGEVMNVKFTNIENGIFEGVASVREIIVPIKYRLIE